MEKTKILVVYDSVFGNTKKVALAVADSLGSRNAKAVQASDVKPEDMHNIELLVAGSPTRVFRPTKAITKFLKKIPEGSLKGVDVAAFDTRMSIDDTKSKILKILARMFGYAAGPMANRMEKKGGRLVVPPEGFFVKDTEGPLKDGELKRAASWAKQILKKR